MLVAEASTDDKSRAEALINAKSRAEAPIDTAHRYRVTSGSSTITEGRFKVGFKVVSLFFWARGFLCFFMDGHPQATVVLFPCSLSQGFKEATMGITLFHLFICFLLYGV
jgi:hypothetical protein